MKKVLKKLFSSFLALSMAFVTVAPVCAKESNVQPTVEPRASTYTITQSKEIIVYDGSTKVDVVKPSVTATIKDVNGQLTIESYTVNSDSKVVNGKVISAHKYSSSRKGMDVTVTWKVWCQLDYTYEIVTYHFG